MNYLKEILNDIIFLFVKILIFLRVIFFNNIKNNVLNKFCILLKC